MSGLLCGKCRIDKKILHFFNGDDPGAGLFGNLGDRLKSINVPFDTSGD